MDGEASRISLENSRKNVVNSEEVANKLEMLQP